MRDFAVSVRKLTDEALMREACESTFIGKSHTSLAAIYKSEHSPARTQQFWIKLENIKLSVASHFVRHHVGVVPFQLSCREDRKGGNVGHATKINNVIEQLNNGEATQNIVDELVWLRDYSDRNTRVNLSLYANAQSLIDMAKLRLCFQAHKDTREVFDAIRVEVAKVDKDLAAMMVKKCVYRNGLCGEPRCCGYNKTENFAKESETYNSLFK